MRAVMKIQPPTTQAKLGVGNGIVIPGKVVLASRRRLHRLDFADHAALLDQFVCGGLAGRQAKLQQQDGTQIWLSLNPWPTQPSLSNSTPHPLPRVSRMPGRLGKLPAFASLLAVLVAIVFSFLFFFLVCQRKLQDLLFVSGNPRKEISMFRLLVLEGSY